MNTTKTRICDTAISLFGKKGYDNVSLREIAEAAGTTIGNLTYHFAQKELLLDAIAQRFQEDFFPEFESLAAGTQQLENIVLTFFRAQANEERGSVYYQNVFEFAKSSPSLEKRNKMFRKALYEYYYTAFITMRENGIIKKVMTDQELKVLVYTIVFSSSLWIQNASPYYDEALPKIPLSEALCNLLKPHISKEYIQDYSQICEKLKGDYQSESLNQS